MDVINAYNKRIIAGAGPEISLYSNDAGALSTLNSIYDRFSASGFQAGLHYFGPTG